MYRRTIQVDCSTVPRSRRCRLVITSTRRSESSSAGHQARHLPSDHPIDQLTTTEQSSLSLCEDWYNFTPVVDVRDVQTGA